MSASQIPNLLSSRSGPRSRRRGRGRGAPLPPDQPSNSRNDQTIQATDTDAAVARLSAVSAGYLDDIYASYFVHGPGTRRLPIINRGTYVRTSALDSLINAFLSSTTTTDSAPDRQIVSLGAGTDTRYFRLRAQGRTRRLIYHEFDFPAVCAAKCRIVESKKVLTSDEVLAPADGQGSADIQRDGTLDWELLRSRENDGNVLEAGYHCHALDLRKLPTIADLGAFQGLRSDLPTLVISECCLCYLEVDVATQILKWFTDRIPSLGIVLYEPIGAYDAFGQMMVENLAARGIVMPTVQRYKTLRDQVDRLKEAGFGFGGDAAGKANAVTIEEVWDEWIEAVDKERVDGLEGLDEVEEWQMLARHYAVVWGWRGVEGWEGWRNSPHGSPR